MLEVFDSQSPWSQKDFNVEKGNDACMAKNLQTLHICRTWESGNTFSQRPKELCRVHFFIHFSIFRVSSLGEFYWVCMTGFSEARVYRSGFCGQLLEASPVSDRANASQLQDRPITGQGRAHQQWW